MNKRVFALILSLILFPVVASAGGQDEMWPGGSYDPAVPTPQSVLGYQLGARHTPHHLIGSYLEAVAEASDRVILRVIGQTTQGRNQYYVVISSPENMARLDEIRERIHSLAEPALLGGAGETEETIGSTPAIALLNYTVHGDEGSGAEAALRTVYQLAAGTDEATLEILREVVTLIDPVQNPDGHDRYVNFINGYLVSQENPDTQSREHRQPWPGGRTNAYYFDLNRDWFLMTQVETVNRMREYLRWLPQVAPDLHEMGSNSTYYFAPPMLPINWNIPEGIRSWWEVFGRANAAAFDSFGWTYYMEEDFDNFYPGYGESLPCMLGAVGMTYEQASPDGRVIRRRDGTLLTLRDATWHQFSSSMATLRTAARHREELLRHFHRFFADVQRSGREGPVREFYIPPADPARFDKLVRCLQRVGGTVYRASEPFSARGVYNYFTRQTEDVELPAGTAIVPLAQMAGAAIKTILEPDCVLDEEFLAEERELIRRNEEERIYDITAWSLPLTYGIQAYWSPTSATVDSEPFPQIDGIEAEHQQIPRARVAYLIPPDTNANISLVVRLLSEEYRVRVARRALTIDGERYAPGTAVLRVVRNPESLHERINELAAETGGSADAADTGFANDGIDLGSSNILAVKQPRVALLADRPTSSNSFGAFRYLFEQVYGLPYTALDVSGMAQNDLSRYNVIVLPDAWSWGSYSYQAIMGEAGLEKLKRWVRDGGVLVCIGGATRFATDEDVGLSAAPIYTEREREPGDVDDLPDDDVGSAEEEESEAGESTSEDEFEVDELLYTPGAILRVVLDDRSFLSWGYEDGFCAALANSDDVYAPISEDQGIAAGRYAPQDRLVLSGHVWPEMRELLAGKAYLWHEWYGRGQVICFAENPTFRASYDGLDRLLFNAVVFSLAYAP